jgi:Ca-activated chloride channel family protein
LLRRFCTLAGGAQDIENFRENIEAGYLPLPTDLSFEGLAKDYFFDTSRSACERVRAFESHTGGTHWLSCLQPARAALPPLHSLPLLGGHVFGRQPHARPCSNSTSPCTQLFCPVYSVGLSPDPLLDTPESREFYMAVGLDSGA